MKKICSIMLIGTLVFASMTSSVFAASNRQSVFSDLTMSSQFYEPIYSMYLKEIYEADYSNDSALIHPKKNVTRGDAAYMLYHLLGLTYEDGRDFSDMNTSDHYYEAIETLAARGVIDGFKDGTFRPMDSLTRGQMSKIISSAFDYQIKISPTLPYTDVTEAFKPFVHALSEQGITKGVTATKFAPNRFITRQEMAAFLHRAYKKVPGSEYNDFEVMNTVNEATRKTRMIAVQGLEANFPNQRITDIREDMSTVTVEPYLTKALTDYLDSCYYCDGANVQSDFDFGLKYTLKTLTNTSIIVESAIPSNIINEGHQATIKLVRIKDVWKIQSVVTKSFDDEPLDLSIEQAIDYLNFAIPVHWNEEVKSIKYIGKHAVSGVEQFLVNDQSLYWFNLNTGELNKQ
ncbi:S-layer homology domain-containing protein [Paenisporosarcina indica]|uniref:S-layer homology domain-containing protein n=1 Tax=Paenisporosarcina indica TaxID=650093 RepID=UPI001373334A|nr:S-layer homology domain-containing protein [Paenisporosarcina indica]